VNNETLATPNAPESTDSANNAVPSIDSIAAKMTAMRQQTERNLMRNAVDPATGASEQGNADSPVAPQGAEQSQEPEVSLFLEDEAVAADDPDAQDSAEPVSDETPSDSTAQEVIDFLEFADSNPQAKFKFVRNGQEVIIDAKKAAAILGQGGAIHEEARQLKIQKSEFDEYQRQKRMEQEGLTLAMEFTVQPKLQRAYDEILKTQNYQTTFQQQLASTRDPAQQARIQASMAQNEQYIRQQQALIGQLKPQVDQFRQIRQHQVREVLDTNRKSFTDKELRNEYVFNELREKVAKNWRDAEGELVPGIKNIDLVSSDEYILGLIRDGLKFRDRPTGKSAGASIAALQSRKGSSMGGKNEDQQIRQLRDAAKSGDKKAADNLLVAQLNKLRAARSR
jgi:hypothetical protein